MNFRRDMARASVLLAGLLSASPPAWSQGTKQDYERADGLFSQTQGKVLRSGVVPHWYGDRAKFWYRADLADSAREFLAVDPDAATRTPAFDHAKLAAALTLADGRPQDAAKLPFDDIAIDADGSIRFDALDRSWRYDPAADMLAKVPAKPAQSLAPPAPPPASPPSEVVSPDGTWAAFIKDHNVHLRDLVDDTVSALSFEATAGDAYGPFLSWSPDSARLVALRIATGDDPKVHLIESTPDDRLQPRLHKYAYLKPGDKIPLTRPHLFEVATRREIPIVDSLFPNPWSVDDVRWAADSSRFTFAYNQRGHQVLRVVSVDAATGAAKAVVEEKSRTFIDYAGKYFVRHADKAGEILWMSERTGWNHLFLFDARSGALKNPITTGEWVVRGVDRVDEDTRRVWFRASGIRPGQDPYYLHYCRVNFDGTGLVVLTAGDGNHDNIVHSPDGRFFLDTYSRVDLPPVVELRKAEDGSLVLPLESADWSSLVATGWTPPERFVAKARDDATDIFGVIWRPSNFDASRSYPVIENIYAGPHDSSVPKNFAPYYRAQSLAELGFVVVQIDGMGTSNRSKAFHDVCWKNLGDAGFPDRIRWIKAAAAKYPYLDITRVGLYGGSAGGQNALRGMLMHGDFYKAAAADCGCHDNRMDKIWWNELWMGWPVGPHYADQANATHAAKLTGKLLLTVGELDRNVDPASTMQVVDALIKADKDFELVVFPGADHGAGDSPYGERRRRDFFVRHLLGVEPRRAAPAPMAGAH